jgi:hypothetical protein
MKKTLFVGVIILLITGIIGTAVFAQKITTNKDKLVTLAVQGQIAPAEPDRSYTVTWDGKPKMAIGIGGINYNLKIGEKVFGWANGDRATAGVAAVGSSERSMSSWLIYTSIGNKVKVLSGDAKGEKGVIVGKFGSFVLIHFDDDVLENLSISDRLHVKARGIGLEIEGFKDVFPHGITPEILEKIVTKRSNKLEALVVKEIPGELMGQGAGRGSLSGNWHIQTCYPPDIKKYGLDELRFGDLVLLKDIQTDYGMGYFKGGATLGVICSGPSDISGLGIGVTPILSTRTNKLVGKIDLNANIGKYLGLELGKSVSQMSSNNIKTNKEKLITTAVQGVVQPASSRGYSVGWDGEPKVRLGMASINYSVSMGDPTYGWANTDHVEPDVTIQGRDRDRAGECAIAILGCFGNEARVVSGDAQGAKGFYIGRHAGSDDLVWFPKDVLENLTLNDKIQVKARGVGLKIEGFEDVRVNKTSPELLEKLGIEVDGKKLVVPIAAEVPGFLMGSGIGSDFIEALDYDIQTTDPKMVEKYDLKKLRLGDIVAIRDHYDCYGTGRYEGTVTIGVIIHGWSDYSGHGPGVNPILAAMPGKIETKIKADANIAYYLGLKSKP